MQGARTCARRDGRSFEEILQVPIVVVIQTAHGDTLAIALHFPAHIAVLAAIVSLDGETTVGPRADAWCGNGGVSAAVPPAKLPESAQWRESVEAASPQGARGSPAVVRVALAGE
jgi:hypothetical protein